MSDPSPRVYTVVLNYRMVDDVLRCVSSLRRSDYRDQSLVVVDNGATEATAHRLENELPTTTVLTSWENLGYAGGNNLGIAHALDRGADLVWVLNPDTEVEASTLGLMVETMNAHPTAGIVGCRILDGRASGDVIWSNGESIRWDEGGATAHRDAGRPDRDVPASAPHVTEYVTGASMLVRREVFEQVGLLPERYFLYFEETDFNVRARRVGWRPLIDPRARMRHYQRSYEHLPSPRYVYYYVRNRLLFGQEFSELPFEQLVDSAEAWADGWRRKVERREPDWIATFELLIRWAIDDAAAGRDGRRDDIDDIPAGGGGTGG